MSIREFEPGMDYGVGYDSLSGLVRGDCVIRSSAEPPTGGNAQEILFRHHQVITTLELAKYLDVSASGAINAKWFSESSGKMNFLSQASINQYSVYLLLRVVVKNPPRRMRDVRLTEEAWKLLEEDGAEPFRQRSGDEFVVGLITGGEYLGLLEIEASSEQEKKDISGLIRTRGPSWEVGMEFKNSMSELSSRYSVKIASYQVGGRDGTVPKNVDEMIARAVEFPEQVKGEYAKPYQAMFLDYKALDIPKRENIIDITQQQDVLINLWNWRLKYIEDLSNIEYVLQNPNQFESFSSQELSTQANEIRGLINDITSSASECGNNYRACQLPSNLIEPVVQLPQRKDNLQENNKVIVGGKDKNNLLERLRMETEALSDIGFNAIFEELEDGYGLVLSCTEDLTLVFGLSSKYPEQPPKILMKTSSGSEDISFASDAWQQDYTIADILKSILDS